MLSNNSPLSGASLYLCKYKVNMVLMLGEDYIQLDNSNILTIEYLNDYEFNIRAVLKVGLRLDIRRKIWILKNKRSVTCKFELTEFGMDNEEENSITCERIVWNNVFTAYFNDEEESTDTAVMEARINANEGVGNAESAIDSENLYETQNTLDLYLFDPELLDASNKKFNIVFKKDILQQCVARVLTATKHKKVLMSPFENDEVYSELLVPYNPAYKVLMYLDQKYGFYKTGAIIYYDVDKLYILNSNGKVTAKEQDEYTRTILYAAQIDAGTPGNGMFIRNGEITNYCSINEMDVNTENFSLSTNESSGSEAKVVISDDITIDTASANQSYMSQRNERIVYASKDSNKYISSITKARMEENECVLYVTANNLDINSFKPNKEYQIVFDETTKQERYGKYFYRLAYAYHYFKLESDQYYSCSSQMSFKKRCDDPDSETTE